MRAATNNIKRFCLRTAIPGLLFFGLYSCTSIGVFEKNVAIPGHEWESSFQPEITLTVSDTAAFYAIYFVLRHTNAYEYSNIWVEVTRTSGNDSLPAEQMKINVPLATNETGWLGTGMDDIFEQRRPITPEGGIKLPAGTQHFRIAHVMRKDPLPHIMNAGIRVEKIHSE